MRYKDYIGKVVTFTDKIEEMECNIDPGMRARIRNIEVRDLHMEDKNEHIYQFFFDLEMFAEHNETKMRANYYDKKGRPCLTVKEVGMYEEIESVYFGAPELWPFDEFFVVDTKPESV